MNLSTMMYVAAGISGGSSLSSVAMAVTIFEKGDVTFGIMYALLAFVGITLSIVTFVLAKDVSRIEKERNPN